MDTDQIIEIIKYSTTIVVSLGGFGFIYKIMQQKIEIQKDRVVALEKNMAELEKIKNSEVELWKVKLENITKEVASNVQRETIDSKINIQNPFNVLTDSNTVNIFKKYNVIFEQIDSNILINIELNPQMLLMVHMYYYGLKDYKKSILFINKAIDLEPNNSYYYSYKAGALKKTGLLDDALQECNKALVFNNLNADAYYNIATIYAMKNEKEKAIVNLKTAIQINNGYLAHAISSHYFKGYNLEL